MVPEPIQQGFSSCQTHIATSQPSFLLLEEFELGRRVQRAGSEGLGLTSAWVSERDRTELTSGLVCGDQQPWESGAWVWMDRKGCFGGE